MNAPAIFDPIVLQWGGATRTINPDRVMGAIARVEDVITLQEMQVFSERGAAPMAKLAMAYGSVLRYTGIVVTDEEVYAGMFSGGDNAMNVANAIAVLLRMMVPKTFGAGEATKGKGLPAASLLSKRPTRSRSVPSGVRATNSGA